MESVKVKPAEKDLIVRHPSGRRLSDAGETVNHTNYWARRIAAGDVVEVKKSQPTSKPKAEKS